MTKYVEKLNDCIKNYSISMFNSIMVDAALFVLEYNTNNLTTRQKEDIINYSRYVSTMDKKREY